MKIRLSYLYLFIFLASGIYAQEFKFIEPEQYVCNKIDRPLKIDGRIDDEVWMLASWTNIFVDIEGDERLIPYLDTKAKMLYDNDYFYFAFKIEEPHIWAKLRQRDTVIFYDNDIEIFIDTDASTHSYTELELNAFNTVWDLFLAKPYREGGPVLNNWDYKGLKSAVYIDGTINDPSDIDKAWYVEVALPWKSLLEMGNVKFIPVNGERMRVNFSRVQWETEVVDGEYVKKKNLETGRDLPENNWVWSPIGAIDMHRPEMWGVVIFKDIEGDEKEEITYSRSEEELRQFVSYIYKKQLSFRKRNSRYAASLEELSIEDYYIRKYKIRMDVLPYSLEIIGTDYVSGTTWKSNTEGKLIKI